jgi:hypothetical protein
MMIALATLAACATTSTTRLDASWKAPAASAKGFREVLIITVSPDEFVQQDVQQAMVRALQARGVKAVASGAYFTRYTAAERQRFDQTIARSGADAILLVRVMAADSKVVTTAGQLVNFNGVPYQQVTGIWNVAAATMDPTQYVPPNDYQQVTIHAEASLFERKGERLLWTARTRIDNAQDGDYRKTAGDFVRLTVDAGVNDGMF